MPVTRASAVKMDEQLGKLFELVQQQQTAFQQRNIEEQGRAAEIKGLLEKQMGSIGELSRCQEVAVTFMNTIWSNLESVKTTVNARFESVETMVEKTSERFERRLEEQQGSLKSELKEELLRELSPTDSESGNVSQSGAGVTHDIVMLLPPPITATTPRFDTGRARQRPSPFDGKIPWDVYHTQFELLAQLNKWNQGEKAAHLAVSLRDEAATVLTNLPAANRQDYEALTSALESRFGTKNQIDLYRTRLRTRSRTKEEPLAGLAEDVERLVRLAYPEASESMVQVLAKDQFIDSLCDEDMRLRILQSKPVSVRDALQTALELESFQTASRQKIRTV